MLLDSFFVEIGVLPEYLGNYTGSSYKIKLSDFYNKKLLEHNQCSQLFQKYIIGTLCILISGLATDSSQTGFSLDYADTQDLKISAKIPANMLDAFVNCRYSFLLQMLVIKIGRLLIEKYQSSTKDEDKALFEKKTVKEIPSEYLELETKVLEYFNEYESNNSEDNAKTTQLIHELTQINLVKVLNKDDFFRKILIDYEDEIISFIEAIKEDDFSWDFGQSSGAASESRQASKSICF